MSANVPSGLLRAGLVGALSGAVFLAFFGHAICVSRGGLNFERLVEYYVWPAIAGAVTGAIAGLATWLMLGDARFDERRSKLRLTRGLLGTVLCALGGGLIPICSAVVRRLTDGFPLVDLRVWMFWSNLLEDVIGIAIVFAAIGAAAGWSTFAFTPAVGFLRSLAVIFAAAVAFWVVIGGLGIPPFSGKGNQAFYPEFLLFATGPPNLAALLITAIRIRSLPYAESDPPAQGDPT